MSPETLSLTSSLIVMGVAISVAVGLWLYGRGRP